MGAHDYFLGRGGMHRETASLFPVNFLASVLEAGSRRMEMQRRSLYKIEGVE